MDKLNQREKAINSTSAPELRKIYLSGDLNSQRAVVCNINTDSATLDLSIMNEDETIRYNTVKHYNVSVKALDKGAVDTNLDIVEYVLLHERASTVAQQHAIAVCKDTSIRLEYLKKKFIKTKILRLLGEDKSQEIKIAVALHVSSSVQGLTELDEGTKNKKVKMALLTNVKTPKAIKERIKRCLAGNKEYC